MKEPRVYPVSDANRFKADNLANWYENTDFWLQGRMRHLHDVAQFTAQELTRLLEMYRRAEELPTLVDFGCGEGWIYRLVHESKLSARYVGIDFNERFISELRKRYGEEESHKFYCFDLERPPPRQLLQAADVGVNFFNLFELPNLHAAFKNISAMLKVGGRLLIVNIDPIMQLLAVSSTHEAFIENLRLYEQYQHRLGYDKDIDIGGEPSGRIYKSLLYSTATYVRHGREVGLTIEDYKEVIKTANAVPQIYQFCYFVRRL